MNAPTLDQVFDTRKFIRLNPEGVLGGVAAVLARRMDIADKKTFLTEVRNPTEIATESEAITLANHNSDLLSELTGEGEAQLVCLIAVTLSKTFQKLGLEVPLRDILVEVITTWTFSRKEA